MVRGLRWRVLSALGRREADASASGDRLLAVSPDAASGNGTSRRLNALIEAFGFESYLEIGVSKGKTLEAVRASVRVGVDPAPRFDVDRLPASIVFHSTTSDDFFSERSPDERFDLILVDGLHEYRQSYRDCIAALGRLNAGGVVLIDDVVPSNASAAISDKAAAKRHAQSLGRELDAWMGDVYRTALALATLHEDVEVFTVVGDGWRPQMVIRPRPTGSTVRSLDEVALARLDHREFVEVFSAGIPQAFNARSLEDVLSVLGSGDA